MKKICLVGACALLGTLAAEAKMPGLRMVQLDLARQTETCSFLSNYVDRVSAFGYDTLVLYLEARVATKTFSLPAYYDRRRMKFRSTLTVGLEPESKQWK